MPGKQNNIQKQFANLLSGNQQGKKKGSTAKTNNNTQKAQTSPYRPIPNQLDTLDNFQQRAPQPKVTSSTVPKASVSAAADTFTSNNIPAATDAAPTQTPTQTSSTTTPVYTPPPAFKPPVGNSKSGLGPTIFWIFLVLMIVGGFVLLFFMMRGKFKSIENDIKSLDTDSVDIEPLKRDIQRIGTDVKTLAEKKDENTTDIDYIKALFAEKGADIGTDLESIQLDVLKELLVKSEGVDELSKIISSTIESKSFSIKKQGDGVSIKPNTDTDSEWIFKSDGLVSKNGDDTKTLSFSDEWIRVCNGSNCSETPLTTVVPPVVAATEHDVPPKPLDTLALFNSISVPQLKAGGNTIVV
jgi:hypothetical protein